MFDQYLRNVQIPVLQLQAEGNMLNTAGNNVIAGFNMPVRLTNGQWIRPTLNWQKIPLQNASAENITADANFYINVQKR